MRGADRPPPRRSARRSGASWFEARNVAALLTMRVRDPILRGWLKSRAAKSGFAIGSSCPGIHVSPLDHWKEIDTR